METKPEDFNLSKEGQELIAAVNQTGKPWRKILRELLGKSMDSSQKPTYSWKAQQKGFFDKVSSLPIEGSKNNFFGKDHDTILYGDK